MKRDSHQQAIQHDKTLNEKYEKEACRNNKIAMHIGSACYRLYYRGQPYTDLEDDLLLLYRCGVDVGDINHSHKFAQNYLHSVAEVVKGKIQGFLNTRKPQTGFMPPIKVLADKATYKHRTRQFLGVATVVPDADDLIQYIYLWSPIVKKHDRGNVGKSIISTLEEFNITAEQFHGGSFDGQYFHLSAPKVLNTFFGISENDNSVHYNYDPMHKAGLIDTHIRKTDDFKLLTEVTEITGDVFKHFNWGKNYEELTDTCGSLGQIIASQLCIVLLVWLTA